MKTWVNGEQASVVKKIIDQNFTTVSKHLNRNMLALSSTERELLGDAYLSEGLRVFDTTEEVVYKYTNKTWVKCPIKYVRDFLRSEWVDNEIAIYFSKHLIANPTVELFIKDGESYSPVIGGVSVDKNFDVILCTDLPFEGRVVIR